MFWKVLKKTRVNGIVALLCNAIAYDLNWQDAWATYVAGFTLAVYLVALIIVYAKETGRLISPRDHEYETE